MDLKETANLLMSIKTTYKKWFDGNKEEFARTVECWHDILGNEPYEMAKGAFEEFSRNSVYPPTPADIYKPYKEYLEQGKADKREAINIYYRAISNYPCYEDTAETQQEYMRIIGEKPTPEKAIRFERDLISYVRDRELYDEYIPPLIEYMKGVKKIE